MNSLEPLVSVILPVCNNQGFLESALRSLLSQTHKRLEIIAVDDFSRDKSAKILAHFRRRDKRLKVIYNVKRYGPAITMNRALKLATGDFVAFMSPSDKAVPVRIATQVAFLAENPKIVAVGSAYAVINKHNREVGHTEYPSDHETIYQNLVLGTGLHFNTLMVNRSLIPKDIWKFSLTDVKQGYVTTLLKLANYGEFANITTPLYSRRNTTTAPIHPSTREKVSRFFLLGVKSMFTHGYRPSLRFFSFL